MCEMLLNVVDIINSDSVYLDAKLPKAGNVIDVEADGWNWGNMELTLPQFRIFKAPGLDQTFFEPLLSTQVGTIQGQLFADTTNTLQYRGFTMNLNDPNIPSDIAAYLADSTRAASSMTLDLAGSSALQPFIIPVAPITPTTTG